MADPTSLTKHLYIVLTEPDEAGEVVIANVTSQAPHKDQSCVLQKGDHSSIYHESVINYADAVITDQEILNRAGRQQLIEWDGEVSSKILEAVRTGAVSSPQTEQRIKEKIKAVLTQL